KGATRSRATRAGRRHGALSTGALLQASKKDGCCKSGIRSRRRDPEPNSRETQNTTAIILMCGKTSCEPRSVAVFVALPDERGRGGAFQRVDGIASQPGNVEGRRLPPAIQNQENDRAVRVAKRYILQTAGAKGVGRDPPGAGANKFA